MVGRALTTLSLFIRYWQEAQTLCRVVSQRLADAQSQTETLEIKYSKAKRLVREYQSRYQPSYSSDNYWTFVFKCGKIVLTSPPTFFFFFNSREEEREKREADLRREMEEREKLHKDTVERLQIQVRGDFSILYGFPLLSLPFPCSHCFTPFITDSTAGEEGAGDKEPL